MVDFIITDFESVRGGGNIVDTVPSPEDFIVENCTISSVVSGEFVLTPGESLVGTVSLSANTTSITVGQSVVFSAFVEDTGGDPLEGLTVSFYRDGVSLGSGVSDDSGLVQLTVSSWSVGSFTCTASCQGVSSSGVTVTVSKITSTISLSAVSSTITVGDNPQLTGTLSVGSGQSVKIYLGDVLVDTVTTGTNGAFTYTGSATSSAGSLTFKAVYDGDSTHSSVTSSNVVITVSGSTPVVTTVSLTSDKSILSAYDSESATLSATVLDGSSNPMSGETVTFYNGSTSMGTATTNSSGVATKSYSATGAGDVTFKATCESIDSSTITVEDCFIYDTTGFSYTSTSTADTQYPTGWDYALQSISDFELEFDYNPPSSSFRLYFTGTHVITQGIDIQYGIGFTRDSSGKLTFSVRDTSTQNTTCQSIPSGNNTYRVVFNGNTVNVWVNEVQQVTNHTISWWSSHFPYYFGWAIWGKGTASVTNIKIKPL